MNAVPNLPQPAKTNYCVDIHMDILAVDSQKAAWILKEVMESASRRFENNVVSYDAHLFGDPIDANNDLYFGNAFIGE